MLPPGRGTGSRICDRHALDPVPDSPARSRWYSSRWVRRLPYVLGGSAALVLIASGDVTLNIVAAQLLQGTNSFVLLAIPFFVLAGNLMNHGGITVRLIPLRQCRGRLVAGWAGAGGRRHQRHHGGNVGVGRCRRDGNGIHFDPGAEAEGLPRRLRRLDHRRRRLDRTVDATQHRVRDLQPVVQHLGGAVVRWPASCRA